MAEERRLFYVGITRAMRKLTLLHTFRRTIFGTSEVAQRSRFLDDLPPEVFESRPPVAYATPIAIGSATSTRQRMITGASASIPRTNRGPKPHAATAVAAAMSGRRGRRWATVTP